MVSRRSAARIIAAGRGERLRGAVNDLPKPLVELGGETMLVRQARMLHRAGAETVVALVNSETAGLLAARAVRDSAMDETPGARYAEFDGIAVCAG